MTLFDEAELASGWEGLGFAVFFDGFIASIVNGTDLVGGFANVSFGWKPPLPKRSAWADNYASLFGLYHSDAVNTYLQKGVSLVGPNPSNVHGYPMTWYEASVADPLDSTLGFLRTKEYLSVSGSSGLSFPPSSTGFPLGVTYHQVPLASNPLSLELLPAAGLSQQFGVLPDSVVQGATDLGQGVIQVAGTVAAQVSETAQAAGQVISQGFDYAGNIAAQGGQALMNIFSSPTLRLNLSTGPVFAGQQMQGKLLQTVNVGEDTTTGPAMAWLPVQIPTNAVAMAFDFIVSGDPVDDVLVCGIETNNLFSLEAKYIPTNTVSASRLIDVSAWAGTTNEVFFGLMGGTSTNATVQVDNIRFYSFAPPAAVFSGTPTNGVAALTVNFTDSSSGTITNWYWDFGDGTTTNVVGTSVAHSYLAAGSYPVTLVVSGPTGDGTNSISAYINVTRLDTDSDGVPDWWTQQYFGHATGQVGDSSLASDDADGDGRSNLQEYLAGTSPTDASSAFRITSIAPNPGGGVIIQWSSVAGKFYDVERDTSLTWSTALALTNGVAATPPTNTYTDTSATNAPSYLYRIRLSP